MLLLRIALPASLGTAFLLAACASAPSADPNLSGEMKTYDNPVYGFSFTYPAAYDLKEYAPALLTIGTMSGETMLDKADIEVLRFETPDPSVAYDAFVLDRLRASCAADGPEGSYSCTDIVSKDTTKTHSGATVDEYYLRSEEMTFATGETITDERGPFEAFNIGANVPGSTGFTVLVVRPSSNVPVGEIDEALVRHIRDSMIMRIVEPSAASSSAGRPLAAEGELCGGIAGFQCAPGLTCRYDGGYPDAAGTCIR
jgi:hypothetical protein